MTLETRPTGSPVRLGSSRGAKWPAIVAGAVLLVGVAAGLLWLKDDDSKHLAASSPLPVLCRNDGDCKARHICLEGGCAPLLSSQDPMVWHADLEDQKAAGSSWKPPLEPGESLVNTSVCPAPRGEVAVAEPGKVRSLMEMTVYEVRSDSIRIHKTTKVIGSIWLDNIGFDFPGRNKIDPLDVCADTSVAHVAVLQGVSESLPGRVLALLRQAVPANTPARASISVRFALPEAAADGSRTLSIPLSASLGSTKKVTVVTLPLGAQVDALRGPAPKEQRLLKGFFAYYFHHGAASEVSLTYHLNRPVKNDLDLTTVRP